MKLLISLISAALVVGCQDNPYQGKPAIKPLEKDPSQQGQPTPQPTPPPPPPPPAVMPPPPPPPDATLRYSLSIPDVMVFTEGKESTYTAKGFVPAPGNVILTFTNLPKGMKYDQVNGVLDWLPDYNAADDLLNPGSFRKVVTAQVQLKSDLDSLSVVTKEFVIIIENATKPN